MKLDMNTRTHLEWLFDNQPDYVRKIKPRKLAEVLERTELQAYQLEEKLKREGLSPWEAHDVVVETVLAPADGPALIQDPPPKALTLRERKAVYRKLEAIEIEDKGLETK